MTNISPQQKPTRRPTNWIPADGTVHRDGSRTVSRFSARGAGGTAGGAEFRDCRGMEFSICVCESGFSHERMTDAAH
jgi:hypothetical protein